MAVDTGKDITYAFLMVIGAGLATTLGAGFAFCAQLASKKMLAISLGLSAGVMIYVSFGEIFMTKSLDAFRDHLCSEEEDEAGECSDDVDDKALIYATLSFFGGVAITAVLDVIVHSLMNRITKDKKSSTPSKMSDDSAEQFGQLEQKEDSNAEGTRDPEHGCCNDNAGCKTKEFVNDIMLSDDPHAFELQKVGLMSGIAIALHNFPEGLATYVAAIAEPSAGLAIAVAIALHNIPEGVVVAMPVYYSTGSRMKGFLWAFLSGVSEPIGGVFGWLVLSNMGDLTYAIMFSVVAGMMVYISFNELIPTALAYDTRNQYVTKSVFIGMAVMAASLLVFTQA